MAELEITLEIEAGMSATAKRLDRIERRGVDKFAERRAELAEAALHTLSELGYARTSLREIAQNSEFSHGVLHYYFKDKADLITCCVRHYKDQCIAQYDRATARAKSYDALAEGFLSGLGDSIRHDAPLHRLWYDIRAQTLFEGAFRSEVAEIDTALRNMIWRIMCRFAELTGEPQLMPASVIYAMIDGLFQQCLFKHLSGDAQAIAQMQADVRLVLSKITKNPAAPA